LLVSPLIFVAFAAAEWMFVSQFAADELLLLLLFASMLFCFVLSGWQLDRVRVLVICSLKTRCKLSDKAYFINLSHKRWPLRRWKPACSSSLALHIPPITDSDSGCPAPSTSRLPDSAAENRFGFRISSISGTNLLPS